MHTRSTHRRALQIICWLGVFASAACAQNNSATPAPMPAGAAPSGTVATQPDRKAVTPKQAREADDAYLQGARNIQRGNYDAAVQSFARAVILNPNNFDYIRAFAYAQEGQVNELLHKAAAARQAGHADEAGQLLQQARALDPNNTIVSERSDNGADIRSAVFDPLQFPLANVASTLDGPVELKPQPGNRPIHVRGDAQSVLRDIYSAWGITTQFDSALPSTNPIRIDFDDVDFTTATALALRMTRAFTLAVQPNLALIAPDSVETRHRLEPQLEETLFLNGLSDTAIRELADMARKVFDVEYIVASPSAGVMTMRTNESTMRLINSSYADMLDGSSDVLLDVAVYEIDRSRTRNIGVELPSSLSYYDLYSEAESILNANQSLLQEALQNSAFVLTGNTLQDTLTELGFLYAAGALSSTQSSIFTGLLGYIGNYNKLPLLGLSLASGTTVNALLQTSDARLLDTVQLRSSNSLAATKDTSAAASSTTPAAQPAAAAPQAQPAPPASTATTNTNGLGASSLGSSTLTGSAIGSSLGGSTSSTYAASFRTGERYPIETSAYTTGASSAITSALSSASSAIQQAAAALLGGTSSVTIPQISYEDLGLTVEATPTIQRNKDVKLALHLKIEALGAGSLNGIPVLNNRELTSTTTIPAGQTAILASDVNTSEMRSIQGLPGLSELPGFQLPERDTSTSDQELLITITPHIVRNPQWHITSRRISVPPPPPQAGGQ